MSTPKSLRLIDAEAEKPALVPPKASGPKPPTSTRSGTERVTPLIVSSPSTTSSSPSTRTPVER
jgi:hypothetical protein